MANRRPTGNRVRLRGECSICPFNATACYCRSTRSAPIGCNPSDLSVITAAGMEALPGTGPGLPKAETPPPLLVAAAREEKGLMVSPAAELLVLPAPGC